MSAALQVTSAEAAAELLARRRARRKLLDFMRYCWWMPQPLAEGIHTRAICERLDQAIDDLILGQSSYLCFEVVFGHGKSDIASRAFPAYFLGRMREMQPDVILSGYGADLVEGFSKKAQSIVESDAYQRLWPGMRIPHDKSAASKWGVEGSVGEVNAAGLGGAITGKRAHLIVLDDFFKNREEAESPDVRNARWESFKSDLVTRRHPATIMIICATPWHVDDIFARIKKQMALDPKFPRFEFINFPAESPQYPTGYLFPERFSPQWYQEQRAMLGPYAAAGLMDCNPIDEHTRRFPPMDQWPTYDVLPDPKPYHRIYAALDPSGGRSGRDGDYAAVWLALALEDGTSLLIDGWVGHATPAQQVAKCFGLHRKWAKKGYGSGIFRLQFEVLEKDEGWIMDTWRVAQNDLQKKGDKAWMMPVVPHYPREKKPSKIERIANWISQGWLKIPAGADVLMGNANDEFGQALRILDEQMIIFRPGNTKEHDDAPDALIETLDNAKAGGPGQAPTEEEELEARLEAAREAEESNVLRRYDIHGRPIQTASGGGYGL